MSKVFARLLPFFIISLFTYACTYPCVKGDLMFSLIGFSDSEADTIFLWKYSKNKNFVNPLDSFSFYTNDIRFTRLSDTLEPVAFTGNALLIADYDYELYFPGSGSLFRIKEINELQSERNYGFLSATKEACINEITSCEINGLEVRTAPFNRIYIRK